MGRGARFLFRPGPLAGLAVVVVALAGWSLLSAESAGDPPSRSGWMRNFVPAAEPAKAPEAAFVDRNGTSYTIDDFRGKVVLVNFWATWCGPCVRELPSIARLQDRLPGTDLVVLALSQDRGGWKKISPFLARRGLKALNAYHDTKGGFARAIKVRGLPTTVIYDRAGNEIGRLEGLAEWDSPEAIALLRHYLAG